MRNAIVRGIWMAADTLDTLRGGLIMLASRVVGAA